MYRERYVMSGGWQLTKVVFCAEGPLSVRVTTDEIDSRARLLKDNTTREFFHCILPGQCNERKKLKHEGPKMLYYVLEASRQGSKQTKTQGLQ